ncbi:NAD(P)H-binding protein [Alteribacillus sp. HJP-4]|uniref:NAD(P)H-binding protein n=1 Tax=Alteribacillus sp. HJP-4 TaxID=2775394 RepID=UPI0035CD10BE
METKTKKRPVIALTGASGYIGKNLLEQITDFADVIALSRHGEARNNTAHVEWRSCDLFSMADAEKGLEGADIAIYLVHSMKPSARLTQGSFEDMDVILADNFAQAAKKNRVQQLIYLSGLIPETPDLSRHLRSRLEVEEILKSYQIPVTTIRAGLIVGPKGSSFPILARLVKRLPVMALPKWTRTNTHPIALEDVLIALRKSIGNQSVFSRSIDVGGPDILTYKEMMKQTAEVMGKKTKMINLPLLTINLSRLWVSLVSNSPKETVYPLIESLIHPMTAKHKNMDKEISYGKIPFKQAARQSLETGKKEQSSKKSPISAAAPPDIQQDVRSVQRIPLPKGKSAEWLAHHYINWLEKLTAPFLTIHTAPVKEGLVTISFGNIPLLSLQYATERSSSSRTLFYITGGAFENKQKNERGRLEFRQIPGRQECIVAIHDYMPSLPWFIYKYTQARVHLLVMYFFRRHLQKYMQENKSEMEERPVLISLNF